MSLSETRPSLGTFLGVYTPSILTILGVVLFLRAGWVVGNVFLLPALAIVALGHQDAENRRLVGRSSE